MQYYFDGDSNLYGGHGEDNPFSPPTKTKQMGSIEHRVKIYVEDYVYTYLYQYGKSGGGREKLAALVGRHYVIEGQDTLVISGAIQGKATVQRNGMECFSDETWEYIGGQMETYFKGMTILGWAHCQTGFGAFLMARDEGFHKEYFKEKWQVLFSLDSIDRQDAFFIYNEEGNGLRQSRGYFIYYDKNREMQEYMLENSLVRPREAAKDAVEAPRSGQRRNRKPTPEERMDAAREIRQVLHRREKEAEKARKGHYAMMAGVSGVFCIFCLCMGLAVMSGLGRLRNLETELVAMQTSYQTLAEDFEGVKVQTAFAAQQRAMQVDSPKEETATAEKKTYTVESGDTLGYISRKFYGDNSGIEKIMEINNLADANRIYEGQALLIP